MNGIIEAGDEGKVETKITVNISGGAVLGLVGDGGDDLGETSKGTGAVGIVVDGEAII